MTDVALVAGQENRDERRKLNNLKSDIVANVFTRQTLLDIYTALGDPTDYETYKTSLTVLIDNKIADLVTAYAAI